MAATPPDELPGLASTLALWAGSERLTIDEVAARAGVDRALIVRVWRAAGFPEPGGDGDTRTFSTRDVELIEIFHAGSEFLGEEVTLQMLRVIGAAAAASGRCVGECVHGEHRAAGPRAGSVGSGPGAGQHGFDGVGRKS